MDFSKAYLIATLLIFVCLGTGFTHFAEKDTTTRSHSIQDVINGSVSGQVTLPDVQNQRSRFRGLSYRARGGSPTAGAGDTDKANKFLNTIVSAHPISFDLPEDISGETVEIRQKDAVFIPNVTPVTVGTIVQFINDDPFFHNVFSLTPGSKFNIGRRPTGDVYSQEISAPKWKVMGIGPISLFCDIHSQMNATILSLDTPYFTRLNEDGSYELGNLPEGEYELSLYSPGFDIESQKVTITSGQNITSNFVVSR